MTKAIYLCLDSLGSKYKIRLPISTPVDEIKLAASTRFSVTIVRVIDEQRDSPETAVVPEPQMDELKRRRKRRDPDHEFDF